MYLGRGNLRLREILLVAMLPQNDRMGSEIAASPDSYRGLLAMTIRAPGDDMNKASSR